MDCTNSQRGSRPGRPQMPPPPCMNTNCGYGGMPSSMPMPSMNRPPMPPRRREASEPRRSGEACIDRMPIAMGYVPCQQWSQTYPLDKSLERGTIFPELDLPFVMGRCR